MESIKDLHSCLVDKTPKALAQGGSASSLFTLAVFCRACKAPQAVGVDFKAPGYPCLSSGSDPGAQQCVHFKITMTAAIFSEMQTLASTSKYSRAKYPKRKPL